MRYLILLLIGATILVSCDEEEYEAKLTIENDVSGTTITQIYFGDFNVGYQLLPGQKNIQKLYGYAEEWPKTGNVFFVMQANQKQVYLQTRASYTLNPNDDLLIVISDTTAVVNP